MKRPYTFVTKMINAIINSAEDLIQVDLKEEMHLNQDFIALLADDDFCVELWTAFANVTWYKKFDPMDDDSQQLISALMYDENDASRMWGSSFRGMGGIIAGLRNEFHEKSEDYITWYCCNVLPYGHVSSRVREALNAMGWFPVRDEFYLAANAE